MRNVPLPSNETNFVTARTLHEVLYITHKDRHFVLFGRVDGIQEQLVVDVYFREIRTVNFTLQATKGVI